MLWIVTSWPPCWIELKIQIYIISAKLKNGSLQEDLEESSLLLLKENGSF